MADESHGDTTPPSMRSKRKDDEQDLPNYLDPERSKRTDEFTDFARARARASARASAHAFFDFDKLEYVEPPFPNPPVVMPYELQYPPSLKRERKYDGGVSTAGFSGHLSPTYELIDFLRARAGASANARYDFDKLKYVEPPFTNDSSDSKSHYAAPAPMSIPSYSFRRWSKKIEIPNGSVGVIIGKSRKIIKYLELTSGAKIIVTRAMDAAPNRLLELTGTSDAIESAEKLIYEVLAEFIAGTIQQQYPGGPAPPADGTAYNYGQHYQPTSYNQQQGYGSANINRARYPLYNWIYNWIPPACCQPPRYGYVQADAGYPHHYQQQPPDQQQVSPPPTAHSHHGSHQKSQYPKYPEDMDRRKIWIGDLDHWMDVCYISDIFNRCEGYRVAEAVHNEQTGELKGYGFVIFDRRFQAEKVLQNLNGTMMPHTDQAFRLNWARQRAGFDDGSDDIWGRVPISRPHLWVSVGNLAIDVTKALLQETFASKFSSTEEAIVITDSDTGCSKGFGFVKFGDVSETKRAMTEMNGVYCSGRPMRVGLILDGQTLGEALQYPPVQYSSQEIMLWKQSQSRK